MEEVFDAIRVLEKAKTRDIWGCFKVFPCVSKPKTNKKPMEIHRFFSVFSAPPH